MPENEETITMKNEKELDPEGMPVNRRLKDADPLESAEKGWQVGTELAHIVDEVTETSPGVQVTSPTPLSGKPSGYMVGSTAPGASEAPQIAVEGPKAARGNAVPEYRPSVSSQLPDQISARQVQADRSNPDGCQAFEVQR
jgi:hypothetical protein